MSQSKSVEDMKKLLPAGVREEIQSKVAEMLLLLNDKHKGSLDNIAESSQKFSAEVLTYVTPFLKKEDMTEDEAEDLHFLVKHIIPLLVAESFITVTLAAIGNLDPCGDFHTVDILHSILEMHDRGKRIAAIKEILSDAMAAAFVAAHPPIGTA